MAAISRLTKKYQATIPREVREALGLGHGDQVVFEVQGETAILRKAQPIDLQFLKGVESTLGEWLSQEDEEAYRDL